ncbi:MAG: hypothetical protein U9Q96_02150 [Patescibacteria group bacterium]|nr:hypothetical protein [Patescibacteria group bacterium]
MKKKRLAKSTRKFIRLEKARIRRGIFDFTKQEEMIQELYKKFEKKTPSKKKTVAPKKKAVKTAKATKTSKTTKATKKKDSASKNK